MDDALGEEATELRLRLRTLIAEHFPDDFLGAFTDDPADLEATQRFCKVLAEEGLLTVAWPEEYGGGGGSVWAQTVVREEMWAHHEPRGPQYMGLNWVGPAIMAHGTDEQRRRHLPPIAAGEVIWCQGFSEPEAGSDLASLRTRAEPDGDGWRITGQKIWTSYAGMAQWCVLAARVGAGQGREGITLFLVPMDAPGITVRPIGSMLGPHHLNEVFLDGVPAGADAVLGGVGEGWAVIKTALAHERVGIARYARCERLLSALAAELGDDWDELPASLHDAWMRALVDVRVARLLAHRAVHAQAAGSVADAPASTARIAVTRADQSVAEVLFDALEHRALEAGPGAPLHGAVEDHWRYAQAATVASGTIEVQRLLVSRELLRDGASGRPAPDLPDEASELGEAARRAFDALGGVEAARRAELDPGARRVEVAPVLHRLGVDGIDPRSDEVSLAAAAVLCEAAGRVALPYPVAAVLVRDGQGRPTAAVSPRAARVDHGDLFGSWRVGSVTGPGGTGAPRPGSGGRLGPFVAEVDLDPGSEPADPADVLLHLLLSAWGVLGTVERALELAVDHVTQREQFGKPLAAFQAVQFQLADAAVATAGLRELASEALRRWHSRRAGARADVLALRLQSQEVARSVLRTAQQLHGAAGVCDEYDVSVLARTVQPALRLAGGAARSGADLLDAVRADGFAGLFPHGADLAPRRAGVGAG